MSLFAVWINMVSGGLNWANCNKLTKKRTENGTNCELHFIRFGSGTIICEMMSGGSIRKIYSLQTSFQEWQFQKKSFWEQQFAHKKGFMNDDLPDLKEKIICNNNLKKVVWNKLQTLQQDMIHHTTEISQNDWSMRLIRNLYCLLCLAFPILVKWKILGTCQLVTTNHIATFKATSTL